MPPRQLGRQVAGAVCPAGALSAGQLGMDGCREVRVGAADLANTQRGGDARFAGYFPGLKEQEVCHCGLVSYFAQGAAQRLGTWLTRVGSIGWHGRSPLSIT